MTRAPLSTWRIAIVLSVLAPSAQAQTLGQLTVGGSLGWASLWDDETHLGPGPALALETTMPLGAHARVGVELGWLPHRRDSGYLAAEGDVLSAVAQVWLFLGPRTWRTRPFLGAGLGTARSSGALTIRDPFFPSASVRQSWALTRGAWDLMLGLRIAPRGRWAVRPELRAGVIGGAGVADAIQTPLIRLQGGVAVEWTAR